MKKRPIQNRSRFDKRYTDPESPIPGEEKPPLLVVLAIIVAVIGAIVLTWYLNR